MKDRQYFVYIMTNQKQTVLYTGVTNDLQRRVLEHKSGKGSVFTKKYRVQMLVYYELGDDIYAAISREKQIKAGSRQDKIDLINGINPEWKDLYNELFGFGLEFVDLIILHVSIWSRSPRRAKNALLAMTSEPCCHCE